LVPAVEETLQFVRGLYKNLIEYSKNNGHPEIEDYSPCMGFVFIGFQEGTEKTFIHAIGRIDWKNAVEKLMAMALMRQAEKQTEEQ